MVVIRLSRGGRAHRPIYTIVACDSRRARDGRFLKKLGQYDPYNTEEPLKNVQVEAMSAYVKRGAALSDTVRTLLKRNKINIREA